MSALLLAAFQAVLQEVMTILGAVSNGSISDSEAATLLQQSAASYKAARANWDKA